MSCPVRPYVVLQQEHVIHIGVARSYLYPALGLYFSFQMNQCVLILCLLIWKTGFFWILVFIRL